MTIDEAVDVLNVRGYQRQDGWQVSNDGQWIFQHPDPETVIRKSAEDGIAIAQGIVDREKVMALESENVLCLESLGRYSTVIGRKETEIAELREQLRKAESRLQWVLRFGTVKTLGSGISDWDYHQITLEMIDRALAAYDGEPKGE